MPGKFLQVDDVAAALAGGGERCHPEGMHGDVGIKLQPQDIAFDQLLHGAAGHGPGREAFLAVASGRIHGPKQRSARISPDICIIQPRLDAVAHEVERLQIPVIPFDSEQAEIAASMWKKTRAVGMSLGDRACLSLAMKTGVPAFTTEGEWDKCSLGVKIVKIR